jgi:hypothetical protein
MKLFTLSAIALTLVAGATLAQEGDPIAIAEASGVCGDAQVIAAFFNADGSVSAECETTPIGFSPTTAGIAGASVLGVLAAVGGGGGGGGTGSTSGTD